MSDHEVHDQLTDDDIMSLTQSTRKRLLNEMIQEGLPSDKEGVELLLHTLADMDRTALGNKRIGANEKQSAADVMVATAIARISSEFGQNNPFEGNHERIIPTAEHGKLPRANPVPGETDVGLSEESYDAMAKKFDT